jgi:putative methionine-R-sulfoxide reductase with GAF domain
MEREDLMSLLEVSRSLISEHSLEGLLELINTTATRIADCERGTVYLIDRDRGEFWSRVKHGEEVDEIRLPVGKGIAGSVAATGDVVNITDAYGDPRSDGGWDGRTGYQTRTVLCLPVTSRQGMRIGVIQLLNKRRGHFSDYDVSVLTALAANAAVAFETAWLLEEMVEKKRMEEGLRIAREIQQGLLPPGPPDTGGGLDIAFRNIPCDRRGATTSTCSRRRAAGWPWSWVTSRATASALPSSWPPGRPSSGPSPNCTKIRRAFSGG